MQDIWGRRTETGHTGEEFREEVQLHLSRHLGEPHIAFSDQDGWAGKSKEPGPPVDVMVIPPEGERRFAYVCTYGSSLKKGGDATAPGGKSRMEFVLATPQKGDPKADLAMLNLAANTVRQFAKLVHIQNVRVSAGRDRAVLQEPQARCSRIRSRWRSPSCARACQLTASTRCALAKARRSTSGRPCRSIATSWKLRPPTARAKLARGA